MDKRIQAWLDARQVVWDAHRKLDSALEAAKEGATLPEKLRQAVARDIVEGAIIWYPEGDDGPFWVMVEEVMYPSDNWKAFVAEDGCRYGLHGAFVEVEEC